MSVGLKNGFVHEVADSRNDRVQVFDADGAFLGVVQTDRPLAKPTDIFMTAEGRFYVANLGPKLGAPSLKIFVSAASP